MTVEIFLRAILMIFILVPIVEMVVLIRMGGWIGVFPTIALVLLTAVAGLALLRQQGFSTLLRARRKMHTGELPLSEMVEGICLAVGGALLLTPGFVTDAIGFACLIPGVRQVVISRALRLLRPRTAHYPFSSGTQNGETLKGDYTRED